VTAPFATATSVRKLGDQAPYFGTVERAIHRSCGVMRYSSRDRRIVLHNSERITLQGEVFIP
jgi:hypothetical protein